MDSLPWLPKYFKIINIEDKYVTGWIASELELKLLCHLHESHTGIGYTRLWDDKCHKGKRMNQRIYSNHHLIPINKHPFMIMNSTFYVCKYKGVVSSTKLIPDHLRKRKKSSLYVEKVDCPSKVTVRRINVFECYDVGPNVSERQKRKVISDIKNMLFQCPDSVPKSSWILVSLPLPTSHCNHPMEIQSGNIGVMDHRCQHPTVENKLPMPTKPENHSMNNDHNNSDIYKEIGSNLPLKKIVTVDEISRPKEFQINQNNDITTDKNIELKSDILKILDTVESSIPQLKSPLQLIDVRNKLTLILQTAEDNKIKKTLPSPTTAIIKRSKNTKKVRHKTPLVSHLSTIKQSHNSIQNLQTFTEVASKYSVKNNDCYKSNYITTLHKNSSISKCNPSVTHELSDTDDVENIINSNPSHNDLNHLTKIKGISTNYISNLLSQDLPGEAGNAEDISIDFDEESIYQEIIDDPCYLLDVNLD